MSGDVTYVRTEDELPPVAIVDRSPITARHKIGFAVIAVIGAIAWAIIAFARGETVNAAWFVVAAICTYVIGFRFYARLIELKIVRPRDDHATPAELFDNGTDYQPTDRRVVFGHHFAAIAGAGPLVGPVLATQMGYLPGTIWIIVGAVFGGAVQDYLVLWISTRRRGRSLGQMARDELGTAGGVAALLGVLVIMVILIAVLALVVVRALAQSPWGVFSIGMTIPIAVFMGCYLRFLRPGRVTEVSVVGFALLLLAVAAGNWVAETPWGASWFSLSPVALSWFVIVYGFAASVLPVWLLLAPRDYLSTFMKVGAIALLAVGICIARPVVQAPAVSRFAGGGDGPVFAGSLFPFLFIIIACGALSGFHALISSGTTPKLLEKESQMRFIGYGGMLTESFVAVMALIAASILDQHLYFAINAPAARTGTTAASAANYVNSLGLAGAPASTDRIAQAARAVGEHSIVARTGGAPTLAFGMSEVLQRAFGGAGLKAFWYHFAIMFEALFILTTVDAGTRVVAFHAVRRAGQPGWTAGQAARPELAARAVGVQPCHGRGVGRRPAARRHRSAGWHQHAVSAVRHRQPAARRDRADRRHRRRRQEGPTEVGVDSRRSAGVGSGGHAHRVVAEDLLRGPGRRLLDAAFPVRGGQSRGRHRVRRGQKRPSARPDHPQHLHPGHPVGPLRGGGRDRGDRRARRHGQGRSRRRAAADRGRPGAVEVVRPLGPDRHGGGTGGAAPVGRAGSKRSCRTPQRGPKIGR